MAPRVVESVAAMITPCPQPDETAPCLRAEVVPVLARRVVSTAHQQ
ncbi:MAG: hypothetical protein ACLTJ8_07620 [Veillonella atypica]